MSRAFISLGSNQGDRERFLDAALATLKAQPGVEVLAVSTYRETVPVGGPANQRDYINAAAALSTRLSAPALLDVLQHVEQRLGRVRTEHHGARTIDLDLLLFDSIICETNSLVLPHPRMHERLFVLEPLAEIASTAVHPVLGRTVHQLLEERRSAEAAFGVSGTEYNCPAH